MRTAWITLWCATAVAGVALSQPADDAIRPPIVNLAGVPKSTISSVDLILRAAAAHVSTNEDWLDAKGKPVRGHHSWLDCDYQYIRFISLWDQETEAAALLLTRKLRWMVTQMSFNPHAEPLAVVPGTSGRLLRLDLRDYFWNAASWQAVAERELYILEPFIDHENAEYLRRRLVCPLSANALKGRDIPVGQGKLEKRLLLPAGSMVTGSQFLRDALETDRNSTYYDLLFSAQRFTKVKVTGGAEVIDGTTSSKKKTVEVPLVPASPKLYVVDGNGFAKELKPGDEFPRGVKVFTWEEGGRPTPFEVPPDKVTESEVEVPAKLRSLPRGTISSVFVNFPKDEEDWEKAFGLDKVKALLADRKIDVDFGAVVEGGLDNPKTGSVVALQNRLLVTVIGPFGAAMETYDTLETSGVKDYSEALIFAGKKFRAGQGARAERDAGELLAYLPNGGQAGLLVNGRGERIEVAGNNVAEDSASTTARKDVRNLGSCIVCHAPEGGYIPPRCVIRDGRSKGVDIKFKDRDQMNRVKAFFDDNTDRIKSLTLPYTRLVAKMTEVPDPKDPKKPLMPGWTGVQLAKEVEAFRKAQDGPLTLDRAAAELGCPVDVAKRIFEKSPLNRLQRLAKGIPIPRRTWQKDGYSSAALILAAERYKK